MTRITLQLLIAVLFYGKLILADPSKSNPLEDPNICGNPVCTSGTGKFKYGPGTQQNYKYSVQIRSVFNGTSKNESRLYVEGTASLRFLTPCDGLLTLSDIKLSENIPRDGLESPDHANSQQFADMISEYSLRFSFNDGIISELCPQDEEKNWVLNFKRGILSMLHNTMKRFDLDHSIDHEEDVRGICPTTYTVVGAKETSLIIEKNKDLKSCQSNSKLHSIIQSTPYQTQPINQQNIVKSTSTCELSVDHNIYNQIVCKESHILEPFSNQTAGATTVIVQQLSLLNEESATVEDQSEITRRTPLIFDHVPSTKPTHGELKESRDLIKKLCRHSKDDLQIEFSDLFSQLIHTLRILSYPALSSLYRHSGATCPTAKKHLLDALPYVSSAASVSLMKDIILQGTVPENTVNEWVMSMAFIARPNKNILDAALQLLKQKSFNPNIALSVSALTHTFCIQHADCASNETVASILENLENRVEQFYDQPNPDKNVRSNIIIALKSLSNIGAISGEFEGKLFKIIEDFNLDIAVRLAAVETFRRLPCEHTRSYFEHIFRNQNENVELRIMAYLQIMKCPNYLLIRTIKHSLEQEEVNQVGSFVWSHLNNIIKTSMPSKIEIQGLLSEKDLVKKFTTDIRKFSHNREGSLYFDEYNIGANYESNVIFSPSSYIPKSAMLNLTVDLFGEVVNLFEIYGRADGLEHYLESLFGPKKPYNNLKDKIPKFRFARSVDDNQIIQSDIDKLPNVVNDNHNEPKVSLGLKVFGNELKYSTFNGNEEILAALRTLNPVDHLKHILSGKEINYNKAAMFLDCNYIIPSGAGLPISLNAIGTASVNIKLHGSLHALGFSKTKELDLTADIQPTVAIDITGEMTVDAFYASTGIKLKTNMYTSSAITSNVKIRGTKLVSVKFSLPRQNTEIFGARSELIVRKHGKEESQGGLLTNRVSESICSWSAVDETVGLKLCADYYFVNVTQISNAPHFLMAGPAAFRLFLNKSDPTAKTYLFEYKSTKGKDMNTISLNFDTPDSAIRHLLSANITINKTTQNLTMILQSSEGVVVAKGKLKNTDDEKYLEFAVDINEKKHFDASLSMVRHKIINGFNYLPKAYLGVNGTRVLELDGTIELISKRDVAQYGIDLKFHTKRLTSKLFGYISKTDNSLATNLKMDYKFIHTKEQRVAVDFTLANRSRKNLAIIIGTCNLNSTAYPNYNIDSNVTFTKGVNHVELQVFLEQNPLPKNHPDADLQTLTLKWLISYKSYMDSKRQFKTVATIQRKSSNLALETQFSFESIGADININCNVKYGNNKEVAIILFWSHPRTTLEKIRAHANITVPSFTPMILKLELEEKITSDWKIDVSGTWFSGHSVSIVGSYQDKSDSLSAKHHIKLYVKSPNFKDINIDLQFYRDNDVLKLDLKADYNKFNYQLYFNHNIVSPLEVTTQAKLKYKTKLYTLSSSSYNGDHQKITVELRLDQIRDINFSLWVYNNQEDYKAAGFEIKWDANRDPNQKLMVAGNFTKLASFNYNADLIIGYPGRTIIGKSKFLKEKGKIDTLTAISWDDGKTFGVTLKVLQNYEDQIFFEINSKVNMPFDEWKVISFDGKFLHTKNMYSTSGSLSWNNRKKVYLDLFGDYMSNGTQFSCEYKCTLDSTTINVPNWHYSIKHAHNHSNYDSVIQLKYNQEFKIDLSSNWKIEQNDYYTNLTGTVITMTPFNGMNKGILVSKICLTNDKYIRGVADLDFDHKRATVNVEAKYKKLMDSLLTVNVTTPDEDYQVQFLLSKHKRHFIALVNYPSGSFGTEVLFAINSLSNFDVKFTLATPIECLQNLIIVGKLKPNEADFRVGWNFLVVGFSGVWHYANVTDFEYSYKIYTPIEDFEENGIVGKLILQEGLDLEVSIKLSNYKLGVKLIGKPKPKTLKELGIEIKNIYGSKKRISDDDSNTDQDDQDPFSWEGLIELDAIIYPTMKGKLEVDQKGPTYIVQGKLIVPHGILVFFDEFEYINVFYMRNQLKITTPYRQFKTVTSDFNLNVQKGHQYILALNLNYENNTELIKSGMFAKYSLETKEIGDKTYNITFKANTPFESFPKLDVFGAFETEENFYRTNLLFNTNRSNISLDATVEIDDKRFLEINSNLFVLTPLFKLPQCHVNLRKQFSYSDNYIEAKIGMPETLKSDIYFKTSWLLRSRNQFRTIVLLETPFMGLENTTLGVDVAISKLKSSFWTAVQVNPIEIEINSNYSNNVLDVSSNLNFNGKRFPVTIKCKVLTPVDDKREFDGTLTLKDKVFRIGGNADIVGNFPVKALITLTHKDISAPLKFSYELLSNDHGYELLGNIIYSDKTTRFNAQFETIDKLQWILDFELQPADGKSISLNAKIIPGDLHKEIIINAKTPLSRLENPKAGAVISYTNVGSTKVFGYFEVTDAKGSMDLELMMILMENMYINYLGKYENVEYSSQSSVIGFYKNPEKLFHWLQVGGDVKVDKMWQATSNVTLSLPSSENMSIEGHIKFPDYPLETHSLFGKLNYAENYSTVEYLAKYRTDYSLKKYGTWGNLSMQKQQATGNVSVEWKGLQFHNYAKGESIQDNGFNVVYKLKTPRFKNMQLFTTQLNYKPVDHSHNIFYEAYLPENTSIAQATILYKEIANMNGLLNVTIPYYNLSYSGAQFETKTNANVYNRYVKVFWKNETAILNGKCDIKTGDTLLHRTTTGNLIIELPLATRHVTHINYKYIKKPQVSEGHATVLYNDSKVLEGKYNCLSESRAGFDKDMIQVELQNKMVPLGAVYVRRHEYETPRDGYNAPTVDSKHVHLYHLQNRSKINVTGEFNVKTTETGQEFVFTAIHSNRTVKIWTDYDVLDQEYKQHSRFELSPSTWIEYDLNLINRTADETFDAQQVQINVLYPRRNFTVEGFYNISDSIVSTDASLMWDKDNKTIQAGLVWRRAALHREQLQFQIKHPSFERDIVFLSEYGYNITSIDGQLVVNYSLNPDQTLTLSGIVSDNSNPNTYNYTYVLKGEHNATNLNLDTKGDFYWNNNGYGTEHYTHYRRSYIPLLTEETLGRVNFQTNEIELKRQSVSGLSYFYGRSAGNFPVYSANISAIHGTNDTSGEFYLNLRKKLVYLDLNMTKDGSQSMHMYGYIPDARSALLDVWRDYNEKKVSDVAYYLRLNHSRLIMSSLKWRPELISDVQKNVRGKVEQLYLELLENINNTKQYVRSETNDAINGIWQDAKPMVHDFLADLRNLTVIEEDFEYFKQFLNNSYYANEFYIKDITTIVVSMFDELALKSHLQSLPKIVQEIWDVMGESGQKIKKSILWAVEKIRTYYKNTTDFIHSLINGDPIEHMSDVFKQIVEKYDDFIKNIHVTFIQYMEQLWSQTHAMMIDNWHKTLAAIEPTFLKIVHYLETIVWNTSKEFLDFLYIRKSEIMESPYFAKFTNFSHDLDRFYKDITGDNTIASIYKYTKIAWNFLKEKYLSVVPFGKELQDIGYEIVMEVSQLQNIPSIKYIIKKYNESYGYVKYYYEYFDVERRAHKFITLIYFKMSDMSVTALETENKQRIPKTKFIFESADGIMLLEQKLPMSWHAFNETPQFQEIPEIKAVYDVQNYFVASQTTFWDFYYDYKPYLDPSDWLPPFKGQAMLLGSKYYVTFDKRYYEFRGSCTYLLARDFVDKNFTLLVSYDEHGRNNELIIVLNQIVVRLNIFDDTITLGDSKTNRLPMEIGDTYFYREADIVTIDSASGFILECNMKFHICMFEMSGWYFGKTAGLWGTLNNEPSDDLLTSSKVKANISDVNLFANSWALENSCKLPASIHSDKKDESPSKIRLLCDEFFTSKVSQLTTCFPRIEKQPFLDICLNSTSEQEACMSAVAYINICAYANTPLRIPDTCVKCNLLNGSVIEEGKSIRLEGNNLPQTADIVFIVEAKKCNKDLRTTRNIDIFLDALHKELNQKKLTENRYSVVLFGGNGVYNEPRSIIMNGQTFSDAKSISNYFNDIPIGDGNSDIFNAIIFANKLLFRPGVSRNFILLPCSECLDYNMEHDYPIIHQLLFESAVSLHILMNEHFALQKEREMRTPFGLDLSHAYSKKDIRKLVGDTALRRITNLPKSTMGSCTSLALETNGSLFSGKYLESDKKNAKKFSTVFAKRVARSAEPNTCVECECTSPNTGVSYMECFPCSNPTRTNIEREEEYDN